ncbi:hypothetical protein ABGB16_21755 [Micromonospora sp. B11E3]|uniref:hypothetical protein n=1 Tax=Micromonospora sp. B11E3 TaxID=3153562 RepID=UPI00325DD282
MPLVPVFAVLLFRLGEQYEACVAEHGLASTGRVNGVPGPCYQVTMWTAGIGLAFYAAVLVTTVVGFVLGVVNGRARRTFAYGRWLCVVVVGLRARR